MERNNNNLLSSIVSTTFGVAIGAALYYAWNQTQEPQSSSDRRGANENTNRTRTNQDNIRPRQGNNTFSTAQVNNHNIDWPSNNYFDSQRRQEDHGPAPAQRHQATPSTSNSLGRPSSNESNRRQFRENNPASTQRQQAPSTITAPAQIQLTQPANTSNNSGSQSNHESNYERLFFVTHPRTNNNQRRQANKNRYTSIEKQQYNQTNDRRTDEASSNSSHNNQRRQANSDPANNSCAFCSKSYKGDKSATRVTWCGHKFHLHCMNRFLPNQKQCPTCSRPIRWLDITNKCVVCFDNFNNEPTDTRTRMICGHKLHTECLQQWTQTKNRCPICKKVINQSKIQRDECVICLETIVKNARKRLTSCGHEFHRNCLGDWLQCNNTCPLCREIIA